MTLKVIITTGEVISSSLGLLNLPSQPSCIDYVTTDGSSMSHPSMTHFIGRTASDSDKGE